MEWLTCIRKTINYVEDHLKDDISIDDIAKQVYVSPMFLQKGFSVMTGISISEYIRNRRLSEAAKLIKETDDSITDIAYRFVYETPESFTKAFSRFHGVTPSDVRNRKMRYKYFSPLNIDIVIKGGYDMDFKIVKMFPLKVIGFQKIVEAEGSYKVIPEFWNEICEKYCANIYAGNEPANEYEKAVVDNCIGEYGVCIDDQGENKFRYMIAGKYCGGNVPKGMEVYEFPQGEWAVFDCVGPIPNALQTLNTKIFKEWLPGNPEYELDGNASVEWYDCINGNTTDDDYHSAIWLPIKRK